MINFVEWVDGLSVLLWTYISVPLIMLFGLYLTIKLKGVQLRRCIQISELFKDSGSNNQKRGISPLHTFYITIGGCIGIGNLVAVCVAIRLGGPGALLWMWVAAIFGMMVKYAEIYLAITYRIPNNQDSYDGGPMYYFKKVFSSNVPSCLFALLLAIYGTEVYMFKVVTDSIELHWGLNHLFVVLSFLSLILISVAGGAKRIGYLCSLIMPSFIAIYFLMGLWVLVQNASLIPSLLQQVFVSAFSGQAAVGGFVGSTAIIAISEGVKRACYTGDVGVGYAAIVCSETSDSTPDRQANMSLLGVFLDTFIICTMTILIVLVTGVWTSSLPETEWVASALSMYFPGMHIFMPILLFLLGFSTLIAFFHVGIKCMKFLFPRHGEKMYYVYASTAFIVFSYAEQKHALMLMEISGALMLILNIYALIQLRHQVKA